MICNSCKGPIRYVTPENSDSGKGYWVHIGASPRHIAIPEEKIKIGYNWEDPECDIIAAVKQLQELFDEQLRSK